MYVGNDKCVLNYVYPDIIKEKEGFDEAGVYYKIILKWT
jgi:hypothetical protein